MWSMRSRALRLVDLKDVLHGARDSVLQILQTLLDSVETAWDDLLLLAAEEALLETAGEVSAVDEAKILEWAMDAADIGRACGS